MGNFYLNILSGPCKGLPTSWDPVETSLIFPVKTGEVIATTCAPGYINSGDSLVTCLVEEQFTFGDKPRCILGKNKIASEICYCYQC